MNKAVVLLSGGIDSVTTMAFAKAEGFDVYALSFDYGQRHSVELEMARKNSELLNVKKHLIIDINLRDIGGSALTDEIEVPKNSAEERKSGRAEEQKPGRRGTGSVPGDIPVTYVPARNTIFLSFALAWAETLGAGDIFIGANAVDYSGYPDCRPEFIKAFEDMANLATKVSVEGKMKFRINAPLIKLAKAEIIKKGVELGVDYSSAWSCYDPVPETAGDNTQHVTYRPCGRCDSCRLRAKGFAEAGVKDPLT